MKGAKKAAPKRRIGKKRGPAPKLDNRPDAAEILEEVREPSANLSAIARRLKVDADTLRAFRDRHTPKPILDAIAQLSHRPRLDLQVSQLERLDAVSAKLELMLDAIDRTLRDPEDPTRYNLDPRAREVTVVFEETVGNQRVQKVRKLGELLDRVEHELGVEVVRWEVKSADPRVLLKDVAVALKPISELLGKTRGEIKPDPAVSLNVFMSSPDWQRVETAVIDAIRPCPRCLGAVGTALEAIGSVK